MTWGIRGGATQTASGSDIPRLRQILHGVRADSVQLGWAEQEGVYLAVVRRDAKLLMKAVTPEVEDMLQHNNNARCIKE